MPDKSTPTPTVESLLAENRTLRHDLTNAQFAAQLLEGALASAEKKTADLKDTLFAAQQAVLTEGMRADRLQTSLSETQHALITELQRANRLQAEVAALCGKPRHAWRHELAELGALARSDATGLKSFLSRRADKYRPAHFPKKP